MVEKLTANDLLFSRMTLLFLFLMVVILAVFGWSDKQVPEVLENIIYMIVGSLLTVITKNIWEH